jgi:hypothetical protein
MTTTAQGSEDSQDRITAAAMVTELHFFIAVSTRVFVVMQSGAPNSIRAFEPYNAGKLMTFGE